MNHLSTEPANLNFEGGSEPGGYPRDWGGGGDGYELGVDSMVFHSGTMSGRIRSVSQPGAQGFGTLTQGIRSDRFQGVLVRYSGYLKTADVRGWAGLWMRVDSITGESLAFDNMATPVDRSIAGSTGWTQYEIVLEVPPEASEIWFGFLLSGTGTVWGDDLSLETLNTTSGTAAPEAAAVKPVPVTASRLTSLVRSTDDAVFVGRAEEQQQFRTLLSELQQVTGKSQPGWSQVVLVHGIGGIGKTRLAGRFAVIAEEPANRGNNVLIRVDWGAVRGRSGSTFATESGPPFHAVLDELAREIASCGKSVSRQFEPYRALSCRLSEVIAAVGGAAADQDDPGQRGTAGGRSAKAIGTALTAGEPFGVPPGLGELALAAGVAADALPALWKEIRSRLGRLKPGDYDLLARPSETLASAFAKGLASAASKRPLILLLDTYEIVEPVGPWLRLVMQASGPRVAWILCGRLKTDQHPVTALGQIPAGRLNELGAFHADVPAARLRSFALGAFDLETLRDYLTQAVPDRAADARQLHQLFQATAGIPLAVRIAAYLWSCGSPIEAIVGPAQAGLDRQIFVSAMVSRLFVHLDSDDTLKPDRDQIYGLALALRPIDAELIGALWGTDHVDAAFQSLARRHDFVLTGQYRLHDAVRSFLRPYLLHPFRRLEVRALNQRAVALLEQRLSNHHDRLPTLEQRMSDDGWMSDVQALVWHRLWIDDEHGWASLAAAWPAAIAYNPSAGRALLDLAGHFAATAAPAVQRRLQVLRGMVGPTSALLDQMAGHDLSEVVTGTSRSRIEPDTGCEGESAAILAWLRGQYALDRELPAVVLRHLTAAAEQAPPEAGRLRRWISRSLIALSSRYRWESVQQVRQGDDSDPYRAATELAVRFDPRDAEAHAQHGTILWRLNRKEEALAEIEAALELGDPSAETHRRHAELLDSAGRHEEALSAADHAVELDPGNANGFEIRGGIHHAMGRYDQALADLNKAIALDQNVPSAFARRGKVHQDQQRHDKAMADFDRAIELHGDYAVALALRGRTCWLSGQYEQALTDLSDAMALDDRLGWLVAERGKAHFLLGRYEEAIDDYNKALQSGTTFDWVREDRGEAHRLLGHNTEALEDFQHLIAVDPDNVFALGSRGQVYVELGRYGEALADYHHALILDRDAAWVLAERGQAYRLVGRYSRALSDLDLAVEQDPPVSWVIGERARTHRDMGRYEKALAGFRDAILHDPQDQSIFASRGETFRRMGRYDEALEDLDRALHAHPDLDWALHYRALGHDQTGRDADALADLRRAESLAPADAGIQFDLSILHLRRGDKAAARARLDRALSLGTQELASLGETLVRLFDLALYHAAIGDTEQTKTLWAHALALPDAAEYIRQSALGEFRRFREALPGEGELDDLCRLLTGYGVDE